MYACMFVCLYVCMVCTDPSTREDRKQFVGSLFPPHESRDSNSSHEVLTASALLTEIGFHSVYPIVVLNSWPSSCISLPRAGLHTWVPIPSSNSIVKLPYKTRFLPAKRDKSSLICKLYLSFSLQTASKSRTTAIRHKKGTAWTFAGCSFH